MSGVISAPSEERAPLPFIRPSGMMLEDQRTGGEPACLLLPKKEDGSRGMYMEPAAAIAAETTRIVMTLISIVSAARFQPFFHVLTVPSALQSEAALCTGGSDKDRLFRADGDMRMITGWSAAAAVKDGVQTLHLVQSQLLDSHLHFWKHLLLIRLPGSRYKLPDKPLQTSMC
ncbi:hypothetical protein FQA47_021291 [Oryzias melastigma]|uniref:Uncharacterized protein n=1 Tax=Oryzias melastigma TaxID=30732 RepID=A0A834C7D0_ORYME|nr:hypothetical protein FQA47_021291 [Oryzias melastigma]